jgi:predicted metal-dependent hydrolase
MKHGVSTITEAPLEPITIESFKTEISAWAERIGVEPAEVHVRPMRRKWASCSSRGRVTFDSALLAQTKDFRDEVIVHELLHLKVPNHGRLFKTLLRSYIREDQGALS